MHAGSTERVSGVEYEKMDKNTVKAQVRGQIEKLAARLGNEAEEIRDDDVIPATGLLDSAAILELVVWLESNFAMKLRQEDINIDNLGTIESMAAFVAARGASTEDG